jgi:hypothetical protein
LTASKISVHAGRISEVAGWNPALPHALAGGSSIV